MAKQITQGELAWTVCPFDLFGRNAARHPERALSNVPKILKKRLNRADFHQRPPPTAVVPSECSAGALSELPGVAARVRRKTRRLRTSTRAARTPHRYLVSAPASQAKNSSAAATRSSGWRLQTACGP